MIPPRSFPAPPAQAPGADALDRELGTIVGQSLGTIAVASEPAGPARPERPAPGLGALPDGRHGCQTLDDVCYLTWP